MYLGRPLLGWMVPALLICAGVSPLRAQGPRLPPPLSVSSTPVHPTRFTSLTDSTTRKRTYWVEGGLIGAAAGLVLSQLFNGLCEDSGCNNDRRALVMLVGGFVMGGLIGGGIEKKS